MHSRLCGWNPGADFGCHGIIWTSSHLERGEAGSRFTTSLTCRKACEANGVLRALSGKRWRRKHLLRLVARCRVAFAGDLFHRPAVENVDQAAAVADEARALQKPGGDGHGGAAHPEHLA